MLVDDPPACQRHETGDQIDQISAHGRLHAPMHRRPRLRSTSTAEHRQTIGRARSRRGHRGGCAPRGLQSTSPAFCGAEGTSTSTPDAAAWRAHSPIGAECARQAALHGYTAPVPSARRSRTDRDPVRNEPFLTVLRQLELPSAPTKLEVERRSGSL